MATWQERFKQGTLGINPLLGNASFKGVPFFIGGHSSTFGKRIAEHEFPQSDTGYAEPLGRSLRRFSVEAYVIGDDHLDQRDAVENACNSAGPGVLIHPYYGRLTVECKPSETHESKDELRISRFKLEFVEAGQLTFTKIKADTVGKVMDSVDAAYLALHEAFLKAYVIASIPYSEAQQIQKVINLGLTAVQDAKKVVGRVDAFFQQITTMANTVNQIFTEADELITGILTLSAFGVTDISVLPSDFVLNRKRELKDIKKMWNFTPVTSFPSATVIPSPATDAVTQAIQVAGVVTAAGLTTEVAFASVEEATATLTDIVTKIDVLALSTSPVLEDNLYVALQDLRTSVSLDIDERSRTLSRLVSYQVNQPLPGIVISNTLYGDVEEEEDIVSRNSIGHPGFVGGAPLQVLING